MTFVRWNRKNGIIRLSSPASYLRPRLGDAYQHMSLHEISDGRDPNRDHSDHRIDARSDGRSDLDGTGHVFPSNAGPDGDAPSDGGEPADERGGQVSSLAVDDTDDRSASPDRVVTRAVLIERTVSLYTSPRGFDVEARQRVHRGAVPDGTVPNGAPVGPGLRRDFRYRRLAGEIRRGRLRGPPPRERPDHGISRISTVTDPLVGRSVS